jgi:hypothetical protein
VQDRLRSLKARIAATYPLEVLDNRRSKKAGFQPGGFEKVKSLLTSYPLLLEKSREAVVA